MIPQLRGYGSCALAFSAFAIAGGLAAEPLSAAVLQPHRAVYDMRLAGIAKGSDIADMRGRMVFELSGSACDGYGVSMRFMIITTNSDGLESVTDLQSAYSETKLSPAFEFATKTFVNERLVEAARGSALRDEQHVGVELKQPSDRSFSFDRQVVFPLQHLQGVIDAAERGEQFYVSQVYDGSETGDKLFDTTAVIGHALDNPVLPRGDAAQLPSALEVLEAWPVSIAYYDRDHTERGERMPDYQLTFVLHENGIARSMALNYGSFQLEGSLVDLSVAPQMVSVTCAQGVAPAAPAQTANGAH